VSPATAAPDTTILSAEVNCAFVVIVGLLIAVEFVKKFCSLNAARACMFNGKKQTTENKRIELATAKKHLFIFIIAPQFSYSNSS
jgi:hypothetical protein